MEARGCRLALAGVTTALLTARTVGQNCSTGRPPSALDLSTAAKSRAPYGSRVAAVLVPCLVAVAIVLLWSLGMGVVKLRERRSTEGGYSPRQQRPAGGSGAPLELHVASLSSHVAARAERLLTAPGLTSGLLLSVGLLSAALVLLLVLTSAGLVVALNRRATHGAYSPSRQEKEGSRVEMWSVTQPPPMERLI